MQPRALWLRNERHIRLYGEIILLLIRSHTASESSLDVFVLHVSPSALFFMSVSSQVVQLYPAACSFLVLKYCRVQCELQHGI